MCGRDAGVVSDAASVGARPSLSTYVHEKDEGERTTSAGEKSLLFIIINFSPRASVFRKSSHNKRKLFR